MSDVGLTTVDNTRVLAANYAGIEVQATIHGFEEALPTEFAPRFLGPKGEFPSTWGGAVSNRIANQGAAFRNAYPNGAPLTGWLGPWYEGGGIG
jgi:hypothetical protein